MNKIVVWDLFGGTQNSIYNCLKENNNYIVYTFDLTTETRNEHYKVDITNNKSFNKLIQDNNIPMPNIITASPPCDSFSIALNPKIWLAGDTSLVMKTKVFWSSQIGPYRQYLKWDKQLNKALAGSACITATINIIERYKPKCWYIENPKTSLLWKYLFLNLGVSYGYNNIAVYGCYGYPTPKPTKFYSNVELHLKQHNVKTKINFGNVDYKQRSSIPNDLLTEIFQKFKDHNEQ